MLIIAGGAHSVSFLELEDFFILAGRFGGELLLHFRKPILHLFHGEDVKTIFPWKAVKKQVGF